MFEPGDTPRVFGVPPGVDFPAALVERLTQAYAGQPPEALARLRLMVNTRRMERRITALFAETGARLLPRIDLITDLPEARLIPGIPQAAPPLRRRLEITQLVSDLLDRETNLAPRSALYDLSDSLAALMAEMHEEEVQPQTLFDLDVSEHSDHWARSLKFLKIVQHYFDAAGAEPDAATRQRMVVQALARSWRDAPPADPVILAGSTGSRGTTMRLMHAVARLPKGALVLPGFDFDMPLAAWDDLIDHRGTAYAAPCEDHPQYRFKALLDQLNLGPGDVRRWSDTTPPSTARTRLLSLALRPAPVTDCWLSEGPLLGDLAPAFENVTLLESQSQREEALAIAMRLRQAVEDGQTAALITPDRVLTRQVTAALDRWNILPDDSAGTPLQLTAPGRFLRHVAALFHRKSDAAALMTLLKHPLTHSGSDRGAHLLWTHELELWLRKNGVPHPTPNDLANWATKQDTPEAAPWAEWVAGCLIGQQDHAQLDLAEHVARHIALARRLAQGSCGDGSGALWDKAPGRKAFEHVSELQQEADAGGRMGASDYAALFDAILQRGEVRDGDPSHPQILIWGTLEARVQGADLMILGGLNEGSWPEMPPPDPWLNRQMRLEAGMLSPERQIGLSAHDFQQAAAAPQVWLTRSIRSDDAQTVPSRWLNRLLNLASGLKDQGGPDAIKAARARGDLWLGRARALEAVKAADPRPRPSPKPPAEARPRKLSVTEIKTLIRDPYAIYAKHVLGLKPINPLMRAPDALLRGTVVHEVLEQFLRDVTSGALPLTTEAFLQKTGSVLAQEVPWPDTRALWMAKMRRIADWFIATETERLALASPIDFEMKANHTISDPPFTLTAKADRIDRDAEGRLHIYDYKTGAVPTGPSQKAFDKQLLLEAAMATEGAFEKIAPAEVARALFIGVGSDAKEVPAPLEDAPIDVIWAEFIKLVSTYLNAGQGFTARRAMFSEKDISDYDQLARFGEWDTTKLPVAEDLS